MRLKNKVAIVTGSRRGIGKAIALEFAKEGADIVVADIDLKECQKAAAEIEKLGRKSIAVKCDVSRKKDVDLLVRKTIAKFGRVDILVNNAGIYHASPLIETKENEWDDVISVNLKSIFLCTQAAAIEMIKKKTKGTVVNITSIAGEVGFANSAAYCASKGGVKNITKELGLELAQYGIRVNAIGPGPIKTPMISFIENDKKVLKQILSGIPLGRLGEPEEIAKAVLFLASDDASYITGQTLFVDGGWLSQ